MTPLQDKAVGAIAGAAVGDALGGATEGWTPEQIRERYGGPVTGIVGPVFADWRTARPHRAVPQGRRPRHRRHPDDARARPGVRAGGDHLDAYAAAEHLVPRLMSERRWIPELEAEALPLQRIFLAEKWLVPRLHYGHVDPREAGVGNIVNCGAAMYMAPVGVVNAGDPDGAYAEAIDIAGRAPVQLRPRGGRGVRRRGRRGVRPGATRGLGRRRRRCGWRRTAPAPRSRRSASARRDFADWDRLVRGACARRSARSTRSPTPTATRASARAGPAGCTRSRSCRSRSAFLLIAGGRLPRDRARRGQLRPRLRLDRDAWPARIAGALGGADAVPAEWREASPRRAASTWTAPAGHGRGRARVFANAIRARRDAAHAALRRDAWRCRSAGSPLGDRG